MRQPWQPSQPRQPGPPLAAFWCERVVYESFDPDSGADISRCSMPTPAEAIHAIRLDVRALMDMLAPIERERALSWTGHGGSVGAVAALHRGSRAGSRSAVRGGGWSGPYGRIWSSTCTTRLFCPERRCGTDGADAAAHKTSAPTGEEPWTGQVVGADDQSAGLTPARFTGHAVDATAARPFAKEEVGV